MGTQAPPQKGAEPPLQFSAHFYCGQNGWMHQDATGYRGRSQPTGLCVRWEPIPLHKKGAEPSPPKKNRPMFIVAKRLDGSRRHLARRYASARRFCVRWGPGPPPQKGDGAHSPILGPFLLWPNGWMHQMPLGMEVGLSPGDFVLDGDSAPCPKTGRTPNFWPMSIVAKRLDG